MTILSTGVATSFIDFTRASNATVTDSDGRVKWAPANLLTNSESFASSPWSTTAASIVSNASTAPNGTSTADAIDADGSGALHYVQVVSSFTYVNAPYTLAAFMKKDTNRYGWISPFDGTSSFGGVFDLQNGVYVGNRTGGGTTAATITPFPNGWYLCTVTYTPAAATTSYPAAFGTNNDGSLGLSDASTGQIFIWGASLYRSDLAMQPNTSAYPMYNPTTPKNLLGYTEDFSNAYWTKSNILAFGSGSVANAILAPTGLQTADLITPDTTNNLHRVFANDPFPSSTKLLFACYAKSNGYTKLGLRETGTTGAGAAFDLTGSGSVIGAYNSGGSTVSDMVISSVGNGWFRISCVFSFASATGMRFAVNLLSPSYVSGDLSASWTADGTSGIYLWGAQLSDSASLDSYSPVYGAAVTSAAYYGPRRDFDGATLACKGLLVEELRTNLQLNSNVFGTSTYLTTVVAGAAASPSGLIDASSLACTSTSGRAILSTSVTSGIVYTFSVFIKAGTNTSAYIELAGTAGSGGAVVFNLSSGTVTSGTGGAIVPAPNGFYRCSVTSTATGTGASDMRIGTGDATSKTVFVYGAQLEANASFATSYIPTGSATATRNPDVANVNLGAIPYGPETTLVVKAVTSVAQAVNKKQLWMGDSIVSIAMDTTSVEGSVPNIATIAGVAATYTPGTPFKAAFAFADGNSSAAFNGTVGAVGTGSPAELQTGKAQIGSNYVSGTQTLNGHIQQITVLPRRLTSTELAARTA